MLTCGEWKLCQTLTCKKSNTVDVEKEGEIHLSKKAAVNQHLTGLGFRVSRRKGSIFGRCGIGDDDRLGYISGTSCLWKLPYFRQQHSFAAA